MTIANKIAFIVINALVIFTALAYGAVHQPIIALFYFVVAACVVLWAVDCFRTGATRFSPNLLQLPIYAAAVYGFVQVIPFGWYAAGGV